MGYDVRHRLSNIISVNKVVTIFYQEFDKSFVFEGESHDYWEFVYADKGELIATAGEEDILLRQGDIIFHEPNEFHMLRADGKKAPNAFVMTFDCHSPAMNYFKGKHLHLNAQQRYLIGQILYEAGKTFNEPFIDPTLNRPSLKEKPILGGQQMIKLYMEQLFILLMRGDKREETLPEKDTQENLLVQLIIQLLEDNLYESLSIDRICAELSYSRTYLCAVFKQATAQGIMQYYTRLKIEEAKKLLREGNLNIAQVSDILKFCNPHYFSSSFKKWVHMSPREYQKSVQKGGGSRITLKQS